MKERLRYLRPAIRFPGSWHTQSKEAERLSLGLRGDVRSLPGSLPPFETDCWDWSRSKVQRNRRWRKWSILVFVFSRIHQIFIKYSQSGRHYQWFTINEDNLIRIEKYTESRDCVKWLNFIVLSNRNWKSWKNNLHWLIEFQRLKFIKRCEYEKYFLCNHWLISDQFELSSRPTFHWKQCPKFFR